MHPAMLNALYLYVLVLCAIFVEVSVIGTILLVFVYGFSINLYALGGLGCCAALLGWWGYNHGRGPGEAVGS